MNIQFFVNLLIIASQYTILSFSFFIIYRIVHFFHLAHAIVFTSGAYFTFLFNHLCGWPLYYAVPIAVLLSSFLGSLMELTIYKPLRKKKSSSLLPLFASLGIYIVLQNFISIVFGDDLKSIRTWAVIEGYNIFGARITLAQIVIIFTSIIILLIVTSYLILSKSGKAMRSIADDPELATISGINSDKVILISFSIGSALAGIAGILVSLDVDMNPTMGMNALLMGVVAMIIGGVGSIGGIVLGSVLLALLQSLGVWYISSQWQDAIAFAILLLFLLFKPEGFFGKKMKSSEV